MNAGQIFFVRHGESVANELNIFSGTKDVPLTPFGEYQAKKSGQKVLDMKLKFDEVHISHLIRVQKTCDIILNQSQNTEAKIIKSDVLNERDFGILTGGNKTLLRRVMGYNNFEEAVHSFEQAPPQGESLNDIYLRVKKYYFEILLPLEKEGRKVLVVCSKYILEMFAMVILDIPTDQYFDFKLPNSTVLSRESLGQYIRNESKTLKEINDYFGYFAGLFLLISLIIGFTLKGFFKIPDSTPSEVGLLSLILMSFMTGISLDLKKCLNLKLIKKAAFVWLLRIILGLLLIYFFGPAIWAVTLGVLLMAPSPNSLPSISVMLGGTGFDAFPVLTVGLIFTSLAFVLSPSADFTFFKSTVIGFLLPLLASQIFRKLKPSKARSFGEKWGFLSALALNIFVFINAVSSPKILLTLETLVVVLVFALYKLINGILFKDDIDRYIGFSTPNIIILPTLFLLVPGFSISSSAVSVLSALVIFAIVIDEKWIQQAYAKKLNLTKRSGVIAVNI